MTLNRDSGSQCSFEELIFDDNEKPNTQERLKRSQIFKYTEQFHTRCHKTKWKSSPGLFIIHKCQSTINSLAYRK